MREETLVPRVVPGTRGTGEILTLKARVSLLVLYSNFIGVKWEKEALVPRVGYGYPPQSFDHNSRRFATRVVQHASLVQDTTLLNCTISIQHLPVVVQCTSHSRELGKRRSWSSELPGLPVCKCRASY